MGKTLRAGVVMDALETLLSGLEIDIPADEVTYLSLNRDHLFVGHRNGTKAGWSGEGAVRSTIVDVYELVSDDARASQLTT